MPDHLISVECQIVVDSELSWVRVPVDRDLWDSFGEPERDMIRGKARTELWHAVAKRTGRELADAELTALPVWVEYPDLCEVEFVGGPFDGERREFRTPEPPVAVDMALPIRPSVAELLRGGELAGSNDLCPRALYVPLLDEHGFRARSRDGAWRYRCC
ncbi:hypothetical protein [Streptomyces sp. C10-9-1]|uniref:hypothetical protein n=1 Tax=Streptomyces sp. C10-9-1 TaxID=1859285 RepID=UPI003F4A15F5